MKPNRRQFVATLAASSMAGGVLVGCKDAAVDDTQGPATPTRPPEPDPYQAPEPLNQERFPWGIQVGDVGPDSAMVSIHSDLEGFGVRLLRATTSGWEEGPVEPQVTGDGVARFELTGLEPDTAYTLVAISEDGEASRPTRFRTALAADGYRVLVLGATSCLGSSNPSWQSLAVAAEERLDAMLMLGDTVYADGSRSFEDYREEYRRAFSTPALAALSASTSFVATWDDHEVDNNWVLGQDGVTQERVDNATAAFRDALPQRLGPGGTQVWRMLSWGDVADILVLDSRGERQPDALTMVSQEQLDWAIEQLQSSTARFKLVLASTHFSDHEDMFGGLYAVDRWQGYPEQRLALLEAMEQVDGVVVITGDLHYGGFHYLARPGDPGDSLVELMAGPAGSFISPLAELSPITEQYPLFLATWSWLRIELDPGTGVLLARWIDDEGAVLAEQTLAL